MIQGFAVFTIFLQLIFAVVCVAGWSTSRDRSLWTLNVTLFPIAMAIACIIVLLNK